MEASAKIKKVRVRMAPSPTGNFHVGSARTALFNWLYAKKNDGDFLLRIEDTDKERSKDEYTKDILTSLAWLGMESAEEPVYQSKRVEIHERYLRQLLDSGHGYYCFCTSEELEQMRTSAAADGKPPKYNGRCRALSAEEVKRRMDAGEKAVIRFKMPDGEIKFKDLVRGEIKFDGSLVGDFVVAKNLNEPLYNFVVVVDDADMEITHVIRGEDHINNTPRQIAVADALGFNRPIYAHIPLLLNEDRSKMSKRVGATTVSEFKNSGYLPEGMINFLALLGWHPQDDKELMDVKDIIEQFDLGRVQKGGAIFNTDKLDWLNNQYIRSKNINDLYELIVPAFFEDKWVGQGREKIGRAIKLASERMSKFDEFKELVGFLFELPSYDGRMLAWKKSTSAEAEKNLKKCLEIVDEYGKNVDEVEKKIMALADDVGRGDVLWPLRVAVSGSEKSPGPFEIIAILGKEETLRRIKDAIERISESPRLDSFSESG